MGMDVKKQFENRKDNIRINRNVNSDVQVKSGLGRSVDFNNFNREGSSKGLSRRRSSLIKKNKQSKLRSYKKIIIFLFFLVCVGLVFYFLKDRISDFDFKSYESGEVQTHVYYSRGSRDKDKKEQYIFSVNDPIQIKIDFKDMNDGNVVKVVLKTIEDEEIKQSVEVPVNNGEGSRFVSLSQLVRKESGKYKVEISINSGEKDKILNVTEFEIK